MMRLTIALIAASATLAACSEQPAAEPKVAATNGAATEMTAISVKTSGTGTVTAIDPVAGKITLDHAPMPEANWPAMTMKFEAKPEIIAGVKVGDRIAFDMVTEGGEAEITAIRQR